MIKTQILKNDIKLMEQSILFHTNRIAKFGQPNPKGPMYMKPFDNIDPMHLLPYLKKILKSMKTDLKKAKA